MFNSCSTLLPNLERLVSALSLCDPYDACSNLQLESLVLFIVKESSAPNSRI
jgi:hypothetical protein